MSNRKITVAIVEDEYPARLRLERMLQAYDWIQIVGSADTGRKAVRLLEQQRPDLVILDIHLPDFDGFDVLKALDYAPMVIFATAYEEYAIKAFEAHSIDYIIKPFKQERLDKALEKMKNFSDGVQSVFNINENQELSTLFKTEKKISMLPVRVGNKLKLIDLNDVFYIKAEDKYAMLFQRDGRKYFCDKSLAQLEEILPTSFIRVHRSFIVHKEKIISIERIIKGRWLLTMDDESSTSIRTSDSYKDEFKRQLNL